MAMVQLRLLPLYRAVPFSPGWWAFSFPYAATVVYAVQWTAAEHAAASRAWTWALLLLVTAGAAVLVGRTVAAGRRPLPAPCRTAGASPPGARGRSWCGRGRARPRAPERSGSR